MSTYVPSWPIGTLARLIENAASLEALESQRLNFESLYQRGIIRRDDYLFLYETYVARYYFLAGAAGGTPVRPRAAVRPMEIPLAIPIAPPARRPSPPRRPPGLPVPPVEIIPPVAPPAEAPFPALVESVPEVPAPVEAVPLLELAPVGGPAGGNAVGAQLGAISPRSMSRARIRGRL